MRYLFLSLEKELETFEEIRIELQERMIPATPTKVRGCDRVCAYRRVGEKDYEVLAVFEIQNAYRDLEKICRLAVGALVPESEWPGDREVPAASRGGLAYAER